MGNALNLRTRLAHAVARGRGGPAISRDAKSKGPKAKRKGQEVYSAGSEADVVAVDYPRRPLRIYATSRFERRWRAEACRREPWTVEWLEQEIGPGDVVYDIGANVGVFSLIGGTLVSDGGVVVAFEPGYANFARLCENIALNGLGREIVPLPVALSSHSGLQAFTYRTATPGQSRHEFEAAPWDAAAVTARGRRTQPMLAMSADLVVERLGVPAPNLVKLDVDGAEAHVLRGSESLLRSSSLRSLLIEIDDALTAEVTSIIESYGLRLDAEHRRKPSSTVHYGVFRR